MAARLRAQLAALTTDLSANKISLTSTQGTLSSTTSLASSIQTTAQDLSNNLYRVAQFDSSRNALLSNVKSILTTTKNYEDPTTFPNGKGPYQVDIIPLVIKDKFKMPKFYNTTSTVVPNYTTEEFDTLAAPEVVIAVPSKRTTVETTTYYASNNANQNNNLGNYNMSFEDFCMRGPQGGTDMLALLGETLHPIFLNFYNACLDVNTTTEQRQNLFNLFVNHPDFILRKNTAKVPFKTYNQVSDGNDGVIMDVLTDENNIALINKLVNNINYTTTVTRSSYPLDINGNPTELLPISQNINALGPIDPTTGNNTTPLNANNKMGVVIFVSGSTGNYDTRAMAGSLIASWGYVVINIITSPIWGSWQNFDTRKTICKLLIDKTLPSFSFRDPNNQYFINPNRAYNFEGGSSSANPNRFNHTLYNTNTPQSKIIFERYLYQAIMCTKKLGLYNKINWSNALCIGRSAGAMTTSVIHSLQPDGIASQFTLNDADGNSTGVKPFLCKLKAIISWAGVFYDYTNTPIPKYLFSNELSRNNRFNLGINVLKVPLIHVNGDGDIYDTDDIRDSYFNNGVQTVFQLTKRELSSASNIILGDSMVVYLPTNGHSPGTTSLVLNEGRVGSSNPVGVFSASSSKSLSQYMTIPSINNIVESGVTSESVSIGYNSMKLLLMLQLLAHRFLGDDYPVPQETFSYFGWRVDLMPTHCDILTDHEFMRVGPTAQISYDASYNITLSTNGTNTGGALTYNTVALSVDASKNLVTDANSIRLTNKKIYEDKWTMPFGLGPYQVDAIPMLIKDKFQLPMYSLNQDGDVSGGASIHANGYRTTTLYDVPTAPEVVVYVPSKRTTPEFTNVFRKNGQYGTYGPGSFQLALEDYAILSATEERVGSVQLDASGKRIWERMKAFKDACISSDASQRQTLYNYMINHPDFATIETKVKYPYKVWDLSNNGSVWTFENLTQIVTDISDNGVPIPLKNDISTGKFSTLVTKSIWENSKDASGNSTLLNVSGNVNAINGKLGILFFHEGAGGAPHFGNSNHWAALCASWGYIVVTTPSNPILAANAKLDSLTTLARHLSDSTTTPTIARLDRGDATSQYYISPTGLYGTGRDDMNASSTYKSGSYNIGNSLGYVKTQEVHTMNERFFYQIKCVLAKLGLHNYIDYNNAVVMSRSAGSCMMVAANRLIADNSDASVGKSLYFSLNNIDGTSANTKPLILNPKMLFNWQGTLFDYSEARNAEKNRRLIDMNNISSCAMPIIKRPMITITGDTDYWMPNPFRNQWYNSKIQTIYQNTRKQLLKEPVGDVAPGTNVLSSKISNILQASMILYKSSTTHSTNESPYDPANTTDGYTNSVYGISFVDLARGWELDQYISFPASESVYASGIKSELAYNQFEDIKVGAAVQMLVHRFLGKEYPIPVTAIDDLGIKYDIDPTNCEITTESQYQRIGPVSELSYDASFNLTINTPAIVLTNRTVDNNSTIVEGQSASLSVDSGKNLVTNASGMTFAGFRLSVDQYGNLVIG